MPDAPIAPPDAAEDSPLSWPAPPTTAGRPPAEVDAVVVGAGPNGLVATAALADAGWDVVLLEGNDRVGGAVRSEERFPGYVTDMYSSFYPLSAASPVVQGLELERHGLEWVHAPAVVAHPRRAGERECAVLHRDPAATAAGLERFDRRDGEGWLRIYEQYLSLREPLLDALFTPFPPVRAASRILARTGAGDALRLARFLTLPAKRMGEELFHSEQARLLLAGNAMHADAPFNASVSGVFGWVLVMLGQDVGFPVPRGGAGMLAEALRRRVTSAGAGVLTGDRVERVLVRGGRAVGVRTAGGHEVRARRAVVCDVNAENLYLDLLPPEAVPTKLRDDVARFQLDTPTVKVNYALSGRVPWTARDARAAGTVHVGADERGLVHWSADLDTGVVPQHPFMLVGQMTTTDPRRSPAGTESLWAYTKLPRRVTDDASGELVAERIDRVLERFAPGFRDLVVGREVQRPRDLTAADENLAGGAVNAGTAQLHQQLVFRPVPGLGRPETHVAGLYLGSASAHPGGGVHGAPGWLAARVALREAGLLGPLRRRAVSGLIASFYR